MTEDLGRQAGAPVRSVDRALQVLDILARDGETTLGSLSRELGVHKSTVSRLVDVLARHDLVAVPDGVGGYRLGVGCLRLASATAGGLSVSAVAQSVCDELAADLDETCNVAILSERMAVNVCQAEGTTTIAMRNWIGQSTSPHATSNGKVLLAHLTDAELREVVVGRLPRFTARTIATRDELRRELAAIRTQGYAYAREEYEEGLQAVAAPIRDHTGRVVAALSAAGPVYRLSDAEFPRVRDAVIRAADEVSRRLGHRPSVAG
ncbi:IclR family transcriptional regulator [Nocardioides panacisoli]|uniref:IclR family transcriptional regulator n=1 Tax=Nocardioides panacisoli TaxID=627624 RepID=UPI001C639174|nr:IclR family transcriptional regulator [Nocardioides panacisoli]QYJ02915.1 IclR family transcriptional regulator [Nocardioides panacisoli]